MVNKKKLLLSFTAILTIFITDIYTKSIVFEFLLNKKAYFYNVLPFFNLVEVYNRGVSFGLFGSFKYSNIFFIFLSSLITIGFYLYAIYRTKKMKYWSIISICGGSCGNIYDRIVVGAVRDFLDFYIAGYHWPAFNIADAAICIGAFFYLLDLAINE